MECFLNVHLKGQTDKKNIYVCEIKKQADDLLTDVLISKSILNLLKLLFFELQRAVFCKSLHFWIHLLLTYV